jgi:hypothetical protein
MIPFRHQPIFLATPGEQSHSSQQFKFHMEVVLSLYRDLAHKAVPYLSTMHFDVIILTLLQNSIASVCNNRLKQPTCQKGRAAAAVTGDISMHVLEDKAHCGPLQYEYHNEVKQHDNAL